MMATRTAVAILENARTILAPAGCWTQNAPARRRCDGESVTACSPEAGCWCATGALDRATGRLLPELVDFEDDRGYLLALRLLCEQVPATPYFNPDHGRRDTAYRVAVQESNDYAHVTAALVLGWFDRAIAAARSIRSEVEAW